MTAAPHIDPSWDTLLADYLAAAALARGPARARDLARAERAADAAAGLARWCGVAPGQLTSRQVTDWLERAGPRPYSARAERAALVSVFGYATTAGLVTAHPLEVLAGWSELLSRFASAQRAKGARETSIESHRKRVARFARWAAVEPAAVERDLIVRYLAQPGWGTRTRKAARMSLSVVLEFAVATGLLPANPARLLPVEAVNTCRPYEVLATAAAGDASPNRVKIDRAVLPQHPCWDWAEATGRPYRGVGMYGRPLADLLTEWEAAGSPVVTFLDDPVRAAWDRLLIAYSVASTAGGRMTSTTAMRFNTMTTFARRCGVAPQDVNEELLVRYLSNPSWSAEHRRSIRSSFRVVFGYAYKAGLIASNPSTELVSVRVPSSSPRPTPEAALSASLAGVNHRTRLMILLGALAGLRRAEIASLSIDAITEDGLRIVGKGGRVRMVPIHPALGPEILAYLARTGIREGYLFPGQTAGHLSPLYVGKMLAGALPDQWTAHSLRHRFSSRAYAGCFDIRALQELLGHSSPATTARYVAVPNTALVNAVAAVPPVAGMGAPPSDAPPSDAPEIASSATHPELPPSTTVYPDDDPWAEWAAQSARDY